MKITLEPCDSIVELNGHQMRVWRGVAENGVRVVAFVHRLVITGADGTASIEDFEHELVRAVPARDPTVDIFPVGML